MHLDKRKPYKICYAKGQKSWCEQNGQVFTRGGYPIIDGKPVGKPFDNVPEVEAPTEAEVEAPLEVNSFECKECDKQYTSEFHYQKHMDKFHSEK